MGRKIELSGIDHEVRRGFRKNLGLAESTEDVKKFFTLAVREFVEQVFQGRVKFEPEEIVLAPEKESGFVCSAALLDNMEFRQLWDNTEMPKIIGRFARQANHLIQHLEKNTPDKTEVKMNPTSSHAGRFFNNPPEGKGRRR